jgi:hypothetical protein
MGALLSWLRARWLRHRERAEANRLTKCLKSPDERVRLQAFEQLVQQLRPESLFLLVAASIKDSSEAVRESANRGVLALRKARLVREDVFCPRCREVGDIGHECPKCGGPLEDNASLFVAIVNEPDAVFTVHTEAGVPK